MSGARIDCGKRITDSLIGKNVEIVDSPISARDLLPPEIRA
jgi:hypothetical protein